MELTDDQKLTHPQLMVGEVRFLIAALHSHNIRFCGDDTGPGGAYAETCSNLTSYLSHVISNRLGKPYTITDPQQLVIMALHKLNLKQVELARLLNVSAGQISKWKNQGQYMSSSRQKMIKELMQ